MPPLPFPRERPPCPIDALPEPCRSAVLYAIVSKHVPAAIALTDAIAAIGAIVQCGYDCEAPDGDRIPATINTCAVAPSASGKGASIKVFFRWFLEMQSASPLASESPAAELSRFVSGKVTFASLIDQLNGRGQNLTIQREEGASFLKSDLFKDDADALTQLWSGNPPLDYASRGKKLIAVGARCSVGFRIQPDLMEEYLLKHGRLSYKLGFWPRAVAGCHDPVRFPWNSEYTPPKGTFSPVRYHRRMDRLARRLTRRRPTPRNLVKLDDDAKAFMLELNHAIRQWPPDSYPRIREAVGRAWENTLRLATVLHVFCVGRGRVSRDFVERAWMIVEWSLYQHQLIFVESVSESRNGHSAKTLPVVATAWSPAAPKRPKQPRPMEDADWVLQCLQRLVIPGDSIAVPKDDVQGLSGLHNRAFDAAVAWLRMENRVHVFVDRSKQYLQPLPGYAPPIGFGAV